MESSASPALIYAVSEPGRRRDHPEPTRHRRRPQRARPPPDPPRAAPHKRRRHGRASPGRAARADGKGRQPAVVTKPPTATAAATAAALRSSQRPIEPSNAKVAAVEERRWFRARLPGFLDPIAVFRPVHIVAARARTRTRTGTHRRGGARVARAEGHSRGAGQRTHRRSQQAE